MNKIYCVLYYGEIIEVDLDKNNISIRCWENGYKFFHLPTKDNFTYKFIIDKDAFYDYDKAKQKAINNAKRTMNNSLEQFLKDKKILEKVISGDNIESNYKFDIK